MSQERPPRKTDLAGSRTKRLLVWGLPIAALTLSGFLDLEVRFVWPSALGWMGGACLWNALGCGRMHCFFTGPFFLLMAVASLIHGFDVVSFGPHGWDGIGGLTVVGGLALSFLPERIWGKYARTS